MNICFLTLNTPVWFDIPAKAGIQEKWLLDSASSAECNSHIDLVLVTSG